MSFRAQGGDGSFVLPKPGNPDPPDSGVPRECQGGDRVVDTLGQVSGLLVNKGEKRRHSKIVPRFSF